MIKALTNKAFISQYIALDFNNSSNLKNDIQHRISNETEVNFQKALENIQGDNRNKKGVNFSELTLLAMAYFYERIFPEETLFKDSYYTLNSIKGFFDACNLTSYTAITEVDTTHYYLRNSALFKACYLVIQTAWFFNSDTFGRHQHITYVNHYATSGNKLPESEYKHDINYLYKKYKDVDKTEINGSYGFKMVNEWYYSILFLLCTELKLPTTNFKITYKRNREYNPLVKCSRMLRSIAPFKLIECDIKSAFPSFIDLSTNGDNSQFVYENLQRTHQITRNEAKILFNKWCNSGKYKSIEQTKKFLLTCGYTSDECDTITTLTHSKDLIFYDYMSQYEEGYINEFKRSNPHLNVARLHDALYFIDTNQRPGKYIFDEKCVFGYKQLNEVIYTNSFYYSNKPLPYAYISNLPPASNDRFKSFIRSERLTTPEVIGDIDGFRFFREPFDYIGASFNVNEKYNCNEFIDHCKDSLSNLYYLNSKPVTNKQLFLMLSHIRENSNIVFNVRYLYKELMHEKNNLRDIIIRSRDFDLLERKVFKKDIDFLNAYNKAKAKANEQYRLKQLREVLLNSVITPEKYSFIECDFKGRPKTNELAKVMLMRINKLMTNKERKPKAQTLNLQPLYSNLYKEPVSYLREPNKYANTNNIEKRKIKVYERRLLEINTLVNNRKIVLQYIHILNEILNIEEDTTIQRNEELIQAEKQYLIQVVKDCEYNTTKQAVNAFNNTYKPNQRTKPKPHNLKKEDINTSLDNSIFNHIDPEDAFHKGEQFFNEYLKFNDTTNDTTTKSKRQKIKLPELDFDDWS